MTRLIDRILAAKQRDAEADTSALEREILNIDRGSLKRGPRPNLN